MKTKTVSQLKKQADKVFSEYIRLKYADSNGIVECVTCGKRALWKQMQAGHYITRAENKLRYNEKNVHPQCVACNVFKHGNSAKYAIYLLDKYGNDILRELNSMRGVHQFKRYELEELIAFYTKKVLVLKLKAL